MMAASMSNAAIGSLNESVSRLAETWKRRDKALGDTAQDLCQALTPILVKLDLLATVAELPVDIRPSWVVAELNDLRGQAEDCVQRSVAAIRASRPPITEPAGESAIQAPAPSVALSLAAMASADAGDGKAPDAPSQPRPDSTAKGDTPDPAEASGGQPPPAGGAGLDELRQSILAVTEELTEPLTVLANYLVASRSLLHRVDPAVAGQMLYAIEEAYAQALRAGAIVKRLRRSVMNGKAR